MSVVVTGAAGFIGRALVDELLDHGVAVVGIDRADQEDRPGLTLLRADLLDERPYVTRALRAATAVYHLAGCPGVRDDSPFVEWRRELDNVGATRRVLAAVPLDVPLLVCSSSSVYGGTSGRPSRETDELRPLGGYARSKVEVERLCAQRLDSCGAVTVARPFTVVGPRQRPDMALARWVRAALEDRPLQVFGSLDRTRDFTDVRAAVRAMRLLVERRHLGLVNIGTGQPRTLLDVITTIEALTGVAVSTTVLPADPVEPEHTCADVQVLRAVTGFAPMTDLVDVVRRLVPAAAEVRLSA